MKYGRFFAAGVLAGIAAPSSGAMITQSFDIRAEAFRNVVEIFEGAPPSGGPFGPIGGRFTFTYDPDVSTPPTTEGLSFSGFNFPYVGPVKFAYNATGDQIFVGTSVEQTTYSVSNNGEFGFEITNVSSAPLGSYFVYVTGQTAFDLWLTPSFSVTAAVPEPANWMLMIVGFGVAGAMLRRRRPGRTRRLEEVAVRVLL